MKWAEYDHRSKHQEYGAEGGGAEGAGGAQQVVVAAQTAADAPEAQQSSSWLADTLISLIVTFAVFSVCALCKCSRAPLANASTPHPLPLACSSNASVTY